MRIKKKKGRKAATTTRPPSPTLTSVEITKNKFLKVSQQSDEYPLEPKKSVMIS